MACSWFALSHGNFQSKAIHGICSSTFFQFNQAVEVILGHCLGLESSLLPARLGWGSTAGPSSLWKICQVPGSHRPQKRQAYYHQRDGSSTLHQVLMATEHAHTHMQHSCPTEQHGSYLPSWAAKIPLCIEKTDKQRLFGSGVLESKCLAGCGCGSVSQLVT